MRKFYHQPAFIGCVSLSTGIDYIDVYIFVSTPPKEVAPVCHRLHSLIRRYLPTVHTKGDSVHVIFMARSARVASVRVYFFCSRHTTWILSAAAR